MSTGVQTRSSQRRTKRNIKSPRCMHNCCETIGAKRKSSDQNHRNSTNNIKVKKSTSSKNQKNSTGKRKSIPKNTEKSVLIKPTQQIEVQSTKNPYVLITPLPDSNVARKLDADKKESIKKPTELKRKNKNFNVIKNNKQHLVDKHEEQQVSEEKKEENIKATGTVVKTRRNFKESKERTNEKVQRNVNMHKINKEPVSSKIMESKDQILNSSFNKVSAEEIKSHKQEEIFKKPLLNTKRKLPKSSPSPPLKLRNRRFVNYAESSLDSSGEVQEKINNADKVPIYKQPINENKKKRPRHDLYEFDESDNENVKKTKKRKDANSSSEEYDRTIRNILKNVVNKVRKRKKKVIFSDAKNNNLNIKQITSVPSLKQANIECKPDENVKENKGVIQINVKNNLEKNECRIEQNQASVAPQENISQICDENSGENIDHCFGFDNENIVSNKNNTSKIKIISNIRLEPDKELNLSISSPARFRESRPKANSTMLNVFSPWRFNDINMKRNPHFLEIKQSSLPCISQEMVMDHSIVDKFEDLSRTHMTKTPQRTTVNTPSKEKSFTQKYLTDYFGDKEKTENKENTNISLFDNDLLSPIKLNNLCNNRVDLIKRKILCEKDENVRVHSSTPNRNEEPPEQPPDPKTSDSDHTYFGFSSDEDENREATPKKNKNDKPFRLSVNANVKKYTRQKPKKYVKSPPYEPAKLSDEEDEEQSDMSDEESHDNEVKLFYDLNDTEAYPKESKISKKKKVKWLNDDIQRPKKKKDVMTKEEEEEADKWAAAFNSMCEEIEEFPLEIE